MSAYDPANAHFESFVEARRRFATGEDDPRRLLERCLERVEAREGEVRAFVSLDLDAARRSADAAAKRWRDNEALSPIDGIPFGVKDCFDVAGLPTGMNSAAMNDAPPAFVDAAHVDSLRRAGGVLVGKTTTTEWTMAAGPPTRNPWDIARTPGGSSAGSAAAVAAGMLPLATGSQVRGSGIRPASICGIPAFKPTFGALNRHGGLDPTPTLNHLVLLGATFADIWESAMFIAADVGADPGHIALAGTPELPRPRKPMRLARQYTVGWEKTDAATQAAFERWLSLMSGRGIEILEPSASPRLLEYEKATVAVVEWFFNLFREIRWPLEALQQRFPAAFGDVMQGHLANARKLSVADYEHALAMREDLRRLHRALRGEVDGFITLAHIGPGQLGSPPVGTPWYNDASSAIGAPTLNLPVLAVEGMPVGVQIMGFEGADADAVAMARWILDA